METDGVTTTEDQQRLTSNEHPTLQRSLSVKKDEGLSTSLSASASSSAYRQLRQHRNSWPTIDPAASAAAKAIKRTYTQSCR